MSRHLFPVVWIIEYLGDSGFIDKERVPELLETAQRLMMGSCMQLVEGKLREVGGQFDPDIVLQALFNLEWEKVGPEIRRFQESPPEHQRLMTLRIRKRHLLRKMRPLLNGEFPDVAAAFSGVPDHTRLTAEQTLFHIPHHHPRAVSAVLEIFLGHAKTAS